MGMKKPRCCLHRGFCQQVFLRIEKPPHREWFGGLVDIDCVYLFAHYVLTPKEDLNIISLLAVFMEAIKIQRAVPH